MKTLAVSARLAALALTAALGSTAFAQTPEQAESRITLAMNEAPLAADWQPTLAASGEQAQAESVERELATSVEAISEKLNQQLEAKMARKLELAI
ncbi:MAG: hypothetical protein RJQ10_15490 [Haliea sp.]|uniref:hypothetical protein n=1 Tax=Haliea sp. TaxID=1932666 RepID=UPI0032EDB8C2